MYTEGNNGRVGNRILGINKNMCLLWVYKYAKAIEAKDKSNKRVKVIEMDELYNFMERKIEST